MKKILLACDGINFPEGAFEFVRQLNKFSPIFLTGIFMPQVSFASLWSYSSAMAGPEVGYLLDSEDDEKIKQNISLFESLCQDNSIAYGVHKDYNDLAIPEIHRESRFADLLILSGEKFYQDILAAESFHYLTEAIKDAECPVMVLPEKCSFPSENIIAYDGSASAVYALKQFGYLFPELAKLKTTILFLDDDGTADIPHQKLLSELVQQHYADPYFAKLSGYTEHDFTTWLTEKKGVLLVAGAFGRSSVSQMFHKSFLSDVIAAHMLPVFVAHK
jgi:hypothetical protein